MGRPQTTFDEHQRRSARGRFVTAGPRRSREGTITSSAEPPSSVADGRAQEANAVRNAATASSMSARARGMVPGIRKAA